MPRQYERITFLQDDDYRQMVDHLGDNDSVSDMIAYLAQWDYGDGGDIRDSPSAGTDDRVYEADGYLLTVNYRDGYAGLERIIE
jgi:hypothetical protein